MPLLDWVRNDLTKMTRSMVEENCLIPGETPTKLLDDLLKTGETLRLSPKGIAGRKNLLENRAEAEKVIAAALGYM